MDQEWHLFGIVGWAATMMGGALALIFGVHPTSLLLAAMASQWIAPSLIQPLAYGALLIVGLCLLGLANRWWMRALHLNKKSN